MDFLSSSIEVTFSSSSPSEQCVQIPLVNDDIFEGAEFFVVSLVNSFGVIPTTPSDAAVLISDDDSE